MKGLRMLGTRSGHRPTTGPGAFDTENSKERIDA